MLNVECRTPVQSSYALPRSLVPVVFDNERFIRRRGLRIL